MRRDQKLESADFVPLSEFLEEERKIVRATRMTLFAMVGLVLVTGAVIAAIVAVI